MQKIWYHFKRDAGIRGGIEETYVLSDLDDEGVEDLLGVWSERFAHPDDYRVGETFERVEKPPVEFLQSELRWAKNKLAYLSDYIEDIKNCLPPSQHKTMPICKRCHRSPDVKRYRHAAHNCFEYKVMVSWLCPACWGDVKEGDETAEEVTFE